MCCGRIVYHDGATEQPACPFRVIRCRSILYRCRPLSALTPSAAKMLRRVERRQVPIGTTAQVIEMEVDANSGARLATSA